MAVEEVGSEELEPLHALAPLLVEVGLPITKACRPCATFWNKWKQLDSPGVLIVHLQADPGNPARRDLLKMLKATQMLLELTQAENAAMAAHESE